MRRQMRQAILGIYRRENLREYSTCKFIEILRTPALRREMYPRGSEDTRTKSASLYCHSAPFESIA